MTKRRVNAANERRLEEDRVLFERYLDARDPVDRELLVERFLPLRRSLAGRYRRGGEPFDDVFQAASLGLVKAIDGFDATRGRAFSSYAVPTIVGEIKRYYRDRTWAIHVPRELQELTLAVSRAATALEREHGCKPTVDQLAERLGVSDEDVLEALQAKHAITQQQIGDHVGISQMQVSRILRRCLGRLQTRAGAADTGELALRGALERQPRGDKVSSAVVRCWRWRSQNRTASTQVTPPSSVSCGAANAWPRSRWGARLTSLLARSSTTCFMRHSAPSRPMRSSST